MYLLGKNHNGHVIIKIMNTYVMTKIHMLKIDIFKGFFKNVAYRSLLYR